MKTLMATAQNLGAPRRATRPTSKARPFPARSPLISGRAIVPRSALDARVLSRDARARNVEATSNRPPRRTQRARDLRGLRRGPRVLRVRLPARGLLQVERRARRARGEPHRDPGQERQGQGEARRGKVRVARPLRRLRLRPVRRRLHERRPRRARRRVEDDEVRLHDDALVPELREVQDAAVDDALRDARGRGRGRGLHHRRAPLRRRGQAAGRRGRGRGPRPRVGDHRGDGADVVAGRPRRLRPQGALLLRRRRRPARRRVVRRAPRRAGRRFVPLRAE